MELAPTRKLFDRWASSYDRGVQQTLMFSPVHDAALDAFEAVGPAPGDDGGRAPKPPGAVLDVLADVDLPFVKLLSPLFERAARAHFQGPPAIQRLLEQADSRWCRVAASGQARGFP